ncbi:MAG: PH domain-containing protein [Actinomycetota bacterium]
MSDEAPAISLDWQNEVVAVGSLPAVDDAPFESVERRYLAQQRAAWGVGFGVLAAAAIVLMALAGAPGWVWVVALGPLVVAFIGAWILTGLAFAYRGVQLREHDVSARRGLIGRRTISVPFTRVQHVTVERGLFDRLFGLSSVVIFTAGAIAADARVSGLTPDRADRLREGIINRSNLDRSAEASVAADEEE